MNLKILLPFGVFLAKTEVLQVVVDTGAGSVGFLPHRRDCLAAVVPGILSYQTSTGQTVYLAVDEGVLVKTGPEVLISVHHAIGGTDLGALHTAVSREFLTLDQAERTARDALAKIESGFLKTMAQFHHDR
jgi:F-type H+-transporting ATPase subunit epsilon